MKALDLIKKLQEVEEAFDNPEIDFVFTDDSRGDANSDVVLSFEDMFKNRRDNCVTIYLEER